MNDAAGRLSEDHGIVGTSYGDVFIDLGRRRPPEVVIENQYNRLPE
ncbi:MAG TPA: hypothetical protein VGN81_30415 [Pseudonocardiaceae bacterium]|jgi:hypothetical protein